MLLINWHLTLPRLDCKADPTSSKSHLGECFRWVAFECNRLGRVWTNLELSLYNFWNQTKEEFKWKFLPNPDSVFAWSSRFGKQMFNYFCLSSTYCQVPETNWTDWRFYAKQHIRGMISCFQVGSLTCCLYFYRKPTRIHSFACTPEIAFCMK